MTHVVKSVAEHFGVSTHTVLAWIDRGELRAVNVARNSTGGRPSWRVTDSAIAEFELARTSEVPQKTQRKRKASVLTFY